MLLERSAERRSNTSIISQLARGLLYSYALLAGIWATICISGIEPSQHDSTGTIPVHWVLAAVCALVAVVAVVGWRLRPGGQRRPSWLGLAVGVTLTAASIPALLPFTVDPELIPEQCVAITDAWHPVVAKPTPAETAVFQQVYTQPTPSQLHDADSVRAFLTHESELRATPAFQAASRYETWTFGPGSCVANARANLMVSGLILLGGAAGMAGTLAWRRRSR